MEGRGGWSSKLSPSAAFGAVTFDDGERAGSMAGSEGKERERALATLRQSRMTSVSGSPQKAVALRKSSRERAFQDMPLRFGSLRASSAGTSEPAGTDAFQRAPTLRPVGSARMRSQSSSRSSSIGSRGSSAEPGRRSGNDERPAPTRTAAETGRDAALDALRNKAVGPRLQSLGRAASVKAASALRVAEDEYEAAEAEFATLADRDAKIRKLERDLELNAEYLAAEEEFRRQREWLEAEAEFAHEDEFQKAEREFNEQAAAEKELASGIVDALAPDCTDAVAIEALLDRVQSCKFRHPALGSLRQKLQKLQAERQQPAVEKASPEKTSKAPAVDSQPHDERDGEPEPALNEDGTAVITLECPEGLGPGDSIHVDWRGGEIEIEIPVGVSAGDEFEVEVETDPLPGDGESAEMNGEVVGNPDEDRALAGKAGDHTHRLGHSPDQDGQETEHVSDGDQSTATEVAKLTQLSASTDVVQTATASASGAAARTDPVPLSTAGPAETEQNDNHESASDASTEVSEQRERDHDEERPAQATQLAPSVRHDQPQDSVDEGASTAALDLKSFSAADVSVHSPPGSAELHSTADHSNATAPLSEQSRVRLCHGSQHASCCCDPRNM